MIRRNVVRIDAEKCSGCGLCVTACAEGAIELVNGKARLVSDEYCDGLGACLAECPQGAITMEEREAEAFDEEKAKAHAAALSEASREFDIGMGARSACPGTAVRELIRGRGAAPDGVPKDEPVVSRLANWPVQLKLVSPSAPYFRNADLLLVGDCVPFAFSDFHSRFLAGRAVVVGCPKLDEPEYYVGKLAALLRSSKPRSLTVVHMEVPCCSGLIRIAERAVRESGLALGVSDVTVGIEGDVLRTRDLSDARCAAISPPR